MKGRNTACQRSSGTIRAAHRLYILLFLTVCIEFDIDVAYAIRNTVIKHFDKILDHCVFVHLHHSISVGPAGKSPRSLLFVQINFDIAGKYLILFAKSARDNGKGIGNTILSIFKRKLCNRR